MISDVELDRLLAGWLAKGGERAPESDVEAALAAVATTAQARPLASRPNGRRWLLVAAAAAVLAGLGLAIGIGAGIVRLPSTTLPVDPILPPAPSALTESASPPPAADVALIPVAIEDWSVRASIPATWQLVEEPGQGFDFRHFAGTDPEGHLSVNHESPYRAVVCDPACKVVDVEGAIPYSADQQLDGLKTGVARIAGDASWVPLEDGVLPEVVGGLRLETTAVRPDGREWRRVHIVGLRDRNLVAIAWSQPVDVFDDELLDAVLAQLELPSAPQYSDGDLVDSDSGEGFADYTLPIPGLWFGIDQPTLDGVALSGVDRFAEGRILVSIGSLDGTIGWCDPTCRKADGQTSLEALEATIRDGRAFGSSTSTTLGGEPATAFGTATPVERRYVVAIHDGRPVAVMVDVGDWDVAPGIVDTMLAGFRFIDPPPARVGEVFTTADGTIELGLPDAWIQYAADDGVFLRGVQRMTVRVGSADGTITTCDRSAGPWDPCREVTVATLEELAAAVQPAPIADHGVGPPSGRRTEDVLDGEPSVVTRIQAYEYPAKSGQEVVYIATIHAGRPVLVRIWTSENAVVDLDAVIAGFRFVDGGSEPGRPTYSTGDGRVELEMLEPWKEVLRKANMIVLQRGQVNVIVRVGDPDGTILPCLKRAGGWELCLPIQGTDLETLAAAISPGVTAFQGRPLTPRRETGTLGGEPAIIVRISAPQLANSRRQEIVYIVAMHDERPYIVRIQTTAVRVDDLQALLAGFRFVD